MREAFRADGDGRAHVPAVINLDVPKYRGEFHVKTALVDGMPHVAVKIATGFYDNHAKGLPSGSGLMAVFDATTGVPVALLLDNGFLTDIRTGAAGAVAAEGWRRRRSNGGRDRIRLHFSPCAALRRASQLPVELIAPTSTLHARSKRGFDAHPPRRRKRSARADVVIGHAVTRAAGAGQWLGPGQHTALGSMPRKQDSTPAVSPGPTCWSSIA